MTGTYQCPNCPMECESADACAWCGMAKQGQLPEPKPQPEPKRVGS